MSIILLGSIFFFFSFLRCTQLAKSQGEGKVAETKRFHTSFVFFFSWKVCGHLGRSAEGADSRKHNLPTLRAFGSPELARSHQAAVPREALFICAFADLRSAGLSGKSSSGLRVQQDSEPDVELSAASTRTRVVVVAALEQARQARIMCSFLRCLWNYESEGWGPHNGGLCVICFYLNAPCSVPTSAGRTAHLVSPAADLK